MFVYNIINLLYLISAYVCSLKQSFREYADFIVNRDRQRISMAVKDPRSEEEKLIAMDVQMNAVASANAANMPEITLLADGGGILAEASSQDLTGNSSNYYLSSSYILLIFLFYLLQNYIVLLTFLKYNL